MKEELFNRLTDNDIPCIGMGTFGSDKYDKETVANAVRMAIECGYRFFDCASVYGNEKEIGEIFSEAIEDGKVKRDELFIASKVWNDMHSEGDVIKSCDKTLSDLKLDYLDLFFVHWPFPNYHAPNCSADARNPKSRPFITEEYMITWRQMEKLQLSGKVRRIAMSNMTIEKFKEVLPLCEIMPYAHEMELHPSFQQRELLEYCLENGIQPIGYCPIGSPNRPERDKMPEDIDDLMLPEIKKIAENHKIHPVEVCLKWAVQNGQIPIPFSSKKENLIKNFKAVYSNPLTIEEMNMIHNADKNCRLVKGHVFLWKGAKDWTSLWDGNGKISGWKD